MSVWRVSRLCAAVSWGIRVFSGGEASVAWSFWQFAIMVLEILIGRINFGCSVPLVWELGGPPLQGIRRTTQHVTCRI